MAKIDTKINDREVQKYLKSTDMQAALLSVAQGAASRAGPGYEADVTVGATRARAEVRTGTMRARRDNSRRQTLLRSLRG